MKAKQTYHLTVRGFPVSLEFTKVTDSRRLHNYHTDKKPNLFNVRGAMICRLELPASIGPDFWMEKHDAPWACYGTGFCNRADKWNPRKGRHSALRGALAYFGHDKALNSEITAAFLEEEKKRTKIKGPDRTPKKIKPRKPGLRSILARLTELLEALSTNSTSDNRTLYEGKEIK